MYNMDNKGPKTGGNNVELQLVNNTLIVEYQERQKNIIMGKFLSYYDSNTCGIFFVISRESNLTYLLYCSLFCSNLKYILKLYSF